MMSRSALFCAAFLSAFFALWKLRAGDSPPEPGVALFAIDPAADFPVTREKVEQAVPPTKPYSVDRVRIPSAAPSGVAENDVIPGRDYLPVGERRGSVVILPIWNGPREGGPEDIAARYLAMHGFRAFILPMAYQWERTPRGQGSGRLTVSADLERTRGSIVQTVKDARRVALLLDREDSGRGRVGLFGISLGGFVGALAYAVAPEFHAGVFALAGAGVGDVLLHESSETRRVIADFREKGISPDDVRRRCREFDPETYAKPDRGSGVLLFAALSDPVVPAESTLRLSAAFGDATVGWVPGNHYTSAIFLPFVLEDATRHFSRCLR